MVYPVNRFRLTTSQSFTSWLSIRIFLQRDIWLRLGEKEAEWTDAFDIVKRNFPEAYGTIFATEGNSTVASLNVDTSKTEKTFGFIFQNFEEQVKSVADQYLALLEKEINKQS
jgi:hypothetical protein